jgi:hypothetical protein
MLLRNSVFLGLVFFVLTLSQEGLAQSETTANKTKELTTEENFIKNPKHGGMSRRMKKWQDAGGFRSAKFNMDEKGVMRAIAKDFKISKTKVERRINPNKTIILTIHLRKLLEIGGPADIVYILGYKSKRLIQVNIDWGAGISNNPTPNREVTGVGKLLTSYFLKKRYYKENFTIDRRLNDTSFLLFRGQYEKTRMITVKLIHPKSVLASDLSASQHPISLMLSYSANWKNPDIFRLKGE